jgi:hypothetical protein
MSEATLLKPIVRRVRDIQRRRSNVSGKWFDTGWVTIRNKREMVWRSSTDTGWLSANPNQFTP